MKKIIILLFFLFGHVLFTDCIYVLSLSNTSYSNLSATTGFKGNYMSQSDILLKKMTPLAPTHKSEMFSEYLKNYPAENKININQKEIHEKYYSMKRFYCIVEEERFLKTMA